MQNPILLPSALPAYMGLPFVLSPFELKTLQLHISGHLLLVLGALTVKVARWSSMFRQLRVLAIHSFTWLIGGVAKVTRLKVPLATSRSTMLTSNQFAMLKAKLLIKIQKGVGLLTSITLHIMCIGAE